MSNFSSLNDTEDDYFHSCWICQVLIDPYIAPIVIVLGIIGNIVCISVVSLTYLRRQPTSVYLISLALADSVVLTVILASMLGLLHTQGLCQIIIFLQYFGNFCSVWMLCAFTIERYLAVSEPMKMLHNGWKTKMFTRGLLLVLVMVGIIIYSPSFYFTVMMNGHCGQRDAVSVPTLIKVINYVDTAIVFVIPTLLITVLNFSIARIIRKSTMTSLAEKSLVEHSRSIRARTHRQNVSTSITRMLFLISIVFFFTNVPNYLVRFIHAYFQHSSVMNVVRLTTEYIYTLNFTLNFVLYSLSSKTFRHALLRLFCGKCMKRTPNSHLSMTALREHRTQDLDSSVRVTNGTPSHVRLHSIKHGSRSAPYMATLTSDAL